MKKLLIFGAVKDVILKAKELGYYVIISDQILNIEVRKIVDRYECIPYENFDENLKIAIEEKIDGVLAATEQAVEVTNYIANKLNLIGQNYEAIKTCKSKYEIRKKLLEAGITNVPQFFEIDSKQKLNEIKDKIKYPVILKPSSGLGSFCVYKIENFDELNKNIDKVLEGSFNKKALIETYINGDEYGVETFSYNGEVNILALTKKNMTKLPYRVELGHAVPSGLPDNIEEKIKNTIIDILDKLGLDCGPVNFDLILSDSNEPYIVDLNARLGGNCISTHLVPISTGIDYIENIIKLAAGEKDIDVEPKYSKPVVVRVLDLDEQEIKNIPDFNDFIDDEIVDIIFNKKIGDKVEKLVTCAEKSGFIIACGNDVDKIAKKTNDIRNKINLIVGGNE